MKQNRVGLAFAAMVFVVSCASAPPDEHAPFDAFINQTISESAIPGVAIVVLRDGEPWPAQVMATPTASAAAR